MVYTFVKRTTIIHHYQKIKQMKKCYYISLMFLLIIPINSEAQIGGFLKEKAGQFTGSAIDAADKRLSKKVEDEGAQFGEDVVDKTIDPLDSRIDSASDRGSTRVSNGIRSSANASSSGIGAAMSGLGRMGTVTIPYEENYNFKGEIVMETKFYSNGDEEEPGIMNMMLWMGEDNKSFGVVNEFVSGEVEDENLNMITIADNKNNCYIVLFGGESSEEGGMGMISSIAVDDATNEQQGQVASSEAPNINKTGKTKTIAGYKCDEYLYEEDNSKASVWIAESSLFDFDRFQLMKAGMSTYYTNMGGNGFVMAYEGYVDNELTVSMEVTKVDKNATNKISTEGYYMMQAEQ